MKFIETSEGTATHFRPNFVRPSPAAGWNVECISEGLNEFDNSLKKWSSLGGDKSLPCSIDRFEINGIVRFTVFLPLELNTSWHRLGQKFEKKLWRVIHKEGSATRGNFVTYTEDLISYWQDARTLRSEFVRWLYEARIPFRLQPCNRSWGGNRNLPWSDVVIENKRDLLQIKLKGEEFEAVAYEHAMR